MAFLQILCLLVFHIIIITYMVHTYILLKPNIINIRMRHCQGVILLWSLFLSFELLAPDPAIRSGLGIIKNGSVFLLAYMQLFYYYRDLSHQGDHPYEGLMHVVLPGVVGMISLLLGFLDIFGSQGGIIIETAVPVIMLLFIISSFYFKRHFLFSDDLTKEKNQVRFYTLMLVTVYLFVVMWLDVMEIDYGGMIYGLPLMGIIIFLVSLKYLFYDPVTPILGELLTSVQYGVIVLNTNFDVIDYNTSDIAQVINMKENKDLDQIMTQLQKLVTNSFKINTIRRSIQGVEQSTISGDISLMIEDQEVTYVYYISSIYDRRGKKLAILLTFRDITETTRLLQSIDTKNHILSIANQQLKEHLENVKDLEAEKERERIIREINDTFGHSMTEILALLEVCYLLLERQTDDEVIEKSIEEAINRARKGLEAIRKAVTMYKKEICV